MTLHPALRQAHPASAGSLGTRRPAPAEAPADWTLQALTAEAMRLADSLSLLLRRDGEAHAADFEAVATALRARQIETAVQRHADIPWVIDNESGVGGMALIEHRRPQIRQTADGLRRAMARLKVYSRYRLLPQDA